MAEQDLTLGVGGMACEGCAQSVTRAITRIDPGAKVAVDLPGKAVRISAATKDRTAFEQAIVAAGYDLIPSAVQ
ncbi:MAG: heavy-metal-associated domain-containing protein [Beijerinckiaceae bacterium]|nr:heavy-metal-associated domain-containing protein [Beijerinckiaceae bacterium]MCZ8299391.1 heavy-metal-associated domain-containing protein [Beijerinckiaceae bacterium]